jgi:hypothetical protein
MNPDVLVAIILSAVSPAVVAITALVLNQRGFTRIENRLISIDNRLNRMEAGMETWRIELRAGIRSLR